MNQIKLIWIFIFILLVGQILESEGRQHIDYVLQEKQTKYYFSLKKDIKDVDNRMSDLNVKPKSFWTKIRSAFHARPKK